VYAYVHIHPTVRNDGPFVDTRRDGQREEREREAQPHHDFCTVQTQACGPLYTTVGVQPARHFTLFQSPCP